MPDVPTGIEFQPQREAESRGSSGPSTAVPTKAALLGEILGLLTRSPTHRHLFLADLEWAVMPPLMLGQCRLFRSRNRAVGVALWAFVSEEVDTRLSSGMSRLAPSDWKSGAIPWLVDLVAPFGGAEKMLEEIRSVEPGSEHLKYWEVSRDGKRNLKSLG